MIWNFLLNNSKFDNPTQAPECHVITRGRSGQLIIFQTRKSLTIWHFECFFFEKYKNCEAKFNFPQAHKTKSLDKNHCRFHCFKDDYRFDFCEELFYHVWYLGWEHGTPGSSTALRGMAGVVISRHSAHHLEHLTNDITNSNFSNTESAQYLNTPYKKVDIYLHHIFCMNMMQPC